MSLAASEVPPPADASGEHVAQVFFWGKLGIAVLGVEGEDASPLLFQRLLTNHLTRHRRSGDRRGVVVAELRIAERVIHWRLLLRKNVIFSYMLRL
jgi:hypothetical protein